MTKHTQTPWWTDTEGSGDQQHNVICAQLGAHGTQVVVDDLNAGYLLDPDERYANAAFIVEAVNNHDRLQRRVTALEMIIAEELNPNDCVDEANAMLVEDIHKRADGILDAVSSPLEPK